MKLSLGSHKIEKSKAFKFSKYQEVVIIYLPMIAIMNESWDFKIGVVSPFSNKWYYINIDK